MNFAGKLTLAHVLCLFYPEADLRIGELRWGDSGVYYCKVVIADDLEGPNEGHVELLVLGEPPYTENRNPFRTVPMDKSYLFPATVLATVDSIYYERIYMSLFV